MGEREEGRRGRETLEKMRVKEGNGKDGGRRGKRQSLRREVNLKSEGRKRKE